ncbi:MAG: pseudaminic acid biosynthesis-associated methylase [Candidatus Cloacimonetes bacterium]|nr:pseudaminic acid biosynthesis-associated methylase [Candidatus Cloacimonadota bacterium]
MKSYKTEQEFFWAGEFGDEYVERNQNAKMLASNISLFAQIFNNVDSVKSVIEFGANIGLNLHAIKQLIPEVELSAIEINKKAVSILERMSDVNVYNQSILDFNPDYKRDLTFAKGVLIHIDPEQLPFVYNLLYTASKKYICIIEYYNPTPAEITYRGHKNKLFKRDFAGEMLDQFSDLKLVNYGFIYHRDLTFPQDDISWFLLEKSNS